MRRHYFLIITVAALANSCKKESAGTGVWVKAFVEDTKDMNCGFPRLNFTEDSLKVREITGEKNHIRFIARGLPAELNLQGETILVPIDKLKPEETFPCLTWGPNYPALKILSAKKR